MVASHTAGLAIACFVAARGGPFEFVVMGSVAILGVAGLMCALYHRLRYLSAPRCRRCGFDLVDCTVARGWGPWSKTGH